MENVLLFIQFPYFDDFFRENARDNVEPGFDAHLPVKIKLRYLQIAVGRPLKMFGQKAEFCFIISRFFFKPFSRIFCRFVILQVGKENTKSIKLVSKNS